ncbi:MAG: endopeptidase La [Bacilli bacterium]
MSNTNLPVLLLRNMVLFPFSEIRLEFDELEDKQLLSLAEAYYGNEILVVIPLDLLEEDPDINELPKCGVVGFIKMKMDMPNGKTRVTIEGKSRVKVKTYTKEENLVEANIDYSQKEVLPENKELAYIRTLTKELDEYTNEVPTMSNTLLPTILSLRTLTKVTDIMALTLPGTFSRKVEYIGEMSSITRAEMLLDDMKQDLEILKIEQEIENKLTKKLDKEQKDYILRERIQLIKEELGDVIDKDTEIEELRAHIQSCACSVKAKNRLLLELSRYEVMNPNSPEMGTIKNYIDILLSLPWGNYTTDCEDLNIVKSRLDNTHYGLDQVKTRILEYLAVKQNTKGLRSPIICLVGPPGVGKTSLAASIAISLGRNFTKISVGGVSDEAEIVGHRRTYIGSAPGLIIQGMKKAGTNNPVFIIDEIDKMTKDIKGDPASALLEVLDPEQNHAFVDHYIEEEYDLSKVMFITTANYLYQIPEALRDRLEIVELSSYTEYEKQDIAYKHLIPKQLEEHGLKKEDVAFTEGVILTLIRNYTKEAGVRELERMIATILRKIVKEHIITGKQDIYEITDYNLEKYLGKKKFIYNESEIFGSVGVVNGLAYTPCGGDILPIEATFYPGKGQLILTGSLGDVMKESATLSLSYIKSHADEFHIDASILVNNDIHIHVPEGAVPKDGPSAGVTITSTLLSLLTNTKVHTNIGMTGEMTLRGKVLPIGGLKEKVIGAHRGGIRKIFIPRINEKDLDSIPEEVKSEIKFILVDNYMDIYRELFNKFKRKSMSNNKELIQLPLN